MVLLVRFALESRSWSGEVSSVGVVALRQKRGEGMAWREP